MIRMPGTSCFHLDRDHDRFVKNYKLIWINFLIILIIINFFFFHMDFARRNAEFPGERVRSAGDVPRTRLSVGPGRRRV